ncbi:unnamed protein product, partial [Iphiclides podalirius]
MALRVLTYRIERRLGDIDPIKSQYGKGALTARTALRKAWKRLWVCTRLYRDMALIRRFSREPSGCETGPKLLCDICRRKFVERQQIGPGCRVVRPSAAFGGSGALRKRWWVWVRIREDNNLRQSVRLRKTRARALHQPFTKPPVFVHRSKVAI